MSVLITQAKVARSSTMMCWAENGRVHYEITKLLDTPDKGDPQANRGRMPGDYGSLSIRQGEHRAEAIRAMIGTHDEPGIEKMSQIEARELKRFLEEFEAVLQQAREQGEFGDKTMMDARARAAPTSVSMNRRGNSKTLIAGIPDDCSLEGSVGKISFDKNFDPKFPVIGTPVGRKATIGQTRSMRDVKSRKKGA